MPLTAVNYMAPEQVEGRDADARSDIFAFGAVVYEMATGRHAFTGTSAASVIGAILKDDPLSMMSLQPMAPAALARIVATCLAKDPDERWQSAADLKRELTWIAGAQPSATTTRETTRTRSPTVWIASTVLLAAVLAAVAPAVIRHLGESPARPKVVRMAVYPPPGTTFAAGNASVPSTQLALSPDRRLARVYMARERRGHTLQTTALINEAFLNAACPRRSRADPWLPEARGRRLQDDVERGARGIAGAVSRPGGS